MLLSNGAILRHMQAGNIVISPFRPGNLGTASYDVTLGPWYYRPARPIIFEDRPLPVYNPFSEDAVRRVWGNPLQAISRQVFENQYIRYGGDTYGIGKDELVIPIHPGETLLCHTDEFIGGRNRVNAMMKARSSWGRNFIAVCKCAGWGDVGYVNRWTMEVTNFSRDYIIPLVVGRRIAQIVFEECDPITGSDYTSGGKYQTTTDVAALERTWRPEDMLPKMYADRETKRALSMEQPTAGV